MSRPSYPINVHQLMITHTFWSGMLKDDCIEVNSENGDETKKRNRAYFACSPVNNLLKVIYPFFCPILVNFLTGFLIHPMSNWFPKGFNSTLPAPVWIKWLYFEALRAPSHQGDKKRQPAHRRYIGGTHLIFFIYHLVHESILLHHLQKNRNHIDLYQLPIFII